MTEKRTVFGTPFGSQPGELPLEAGRYRLIWSHSCPWSQRQVIALKLLGLDQVISISDVNYLWTEAHGWDFSNHDGGVDPVLHIHDLKEAYDRADPDFAGDVIVPTVTDAVTGKTVNSDHAAMLGYWEKAWKPFHKEGAPDLAPEGLTKEIGEVNDFLLSRILTAPYKTSGAASQAEYDKGYDDFYDAFDQLEERLGSRRFLLGDYVTDPDLRLYVFLVRYDLLFFTKCGLNRAPLSSFPHLYDYARELYHIPAFQETTFFEDIKKAAQLGDTAANPHQIVTKGPDLSAWDEIPLLRADLSRHPDHFFLTESEK